MSIPGSRGSSAEAPRSPTEAPRSVEDLEVFRLAHQLALASYSVSRSFPAIERFGLSSQLRRAAGSVPSNLAEGAGRLGRPEFRHFVRVAKGSANEARYQILLARDLGYISAEDCDRLRIGYARVGQMLTRLAQSLAQRSTGRG